MKNKNIILIILSVLLAGTGWWFIKNHQMAGGSLEHSHQDHKDLYYCPMHPQITSNKPGTCPICYMKLVKRDDGTSPAPRTSQRGTIPGYSTVSIDTQKQQLMGIKTTALTKKTLTKTLHAYGYVAHDLELYEAQLEYINAWQIYYAYQSRRPVRDEFRQDWREYYKNAPTENRWHSQDKWKAQERLVKAEYELIHMGLTNTELQKLREIKYGQPWVQPSLLFFEKNQPFWIYAQVVESDLGFIAPGQKVIAAIPAYGETVEGIVRYTAPFIDPVTRTSRVRIELPHYQGELSVNMYVNVDMPVELDESLVVPREAIMDTGLNKIVFVQTKEGIFEPRKITTGFEGDGMVAVKSGLKEGETIVSSGNFLLDSESRLQGSLMGGHNHD